MHASFIITTLLLYIYSSNAGYNTDSFKHNIQQKKKEKSNISQSIPKTNVNKKEYIDARNIRATKGHEEAVPMYRSLVEKNEMDFTASSRIAAAYESPYRHDSFYLYPENNIEYNITNDILAFRQLLHECHFTHENVKKIMRIQGDKSFASGPVYIKPVMAGSVVGLPIEILKKSQIREENKDIIALENEEALRCIISMFLLGFSSKLNESVASLFFFVDHFWKQYWLLHVLGFVKLFFFFFVHNATDT